MGTGIKHRGLFITFEGGDGAGKTTLVQGLSRILQEKELSFVSTRAPGGTALGKQIRDLLLHGKEYHIAKRAEFYLFLADRAQHVAEIIRPALEAGQVVLCDRFNDSTIAYQGYGRGLSEEKVAAECAFACEDLQPDCTFYLDIAPKVSMQRAQNKGIHDRIEEEALEFHENIRAAFLRIAKQQPKRVRVLDATRSPEELQQQAWEQIDALLTANR